MNRLHHSGYLNEGDSLVQSRKPRVILLWGQSNCTGQDDYAHSTNANGLVNPIAGVTLSQKITSGAANPIAFLGPYATGPLAPRAAAGQNNLGPELSMGRRLNRAMPGGFAIAKWGIDGSDLNTNWLPTSTYPAASSPPNLFTMAMNDAAAQATALGGVVSGLVWLQGEADALSSTDAAAYQTNLTAFIAAVRVVYPNLPVVIEQVPSMSPETYNSTVRAAQAYVAANVPNVAIFDTSDLGPLITTYHFAANDLVTVGNRCAVALLGLLGIPDAAPVVPWTTDGDVGFPQNATEWAAVMAAAGITSGGPFRASDFTIASGNALDLIASVPLVPSGTGATYNTAVPGFARTGVSTPDAATFKFSTTDASLPDLSTTSMLTLTYARVNVWPGTFRNITSLGSTVRAKLSTKSTGFIDYFEGNTNNTIGTAKPVGAVRPYVVQHNKATTTSLFASDQEQFTATWDATVTGKGLEVGGGANLAANAVTMYEVSFKGAAAELTPAQIRSLLKVLGWPVQW